MFRSNRSPPAPSHWRSFWLAELEGFAWRGVTGEGFAWNSRVVGSFPPVLVIGRPQTCIVDVTNGLMVFLAQRDRSLDGLEGQAFKRRYELLRGLASPRLQRPGSRHDGRVSHADEAIGMLTVALRPEGLHHLLRNRIVLVGPVIPVEARPEWRRPAFQRLCRLELAACGVNRLQALRQAKLASLLEEGHLVRAAKANHQPFDILAHQTRNLVAIVGCAELDPTRLLQGHV